MSSIYCTQLLCVCSREEKKAFRVRLFLASTTVKLKVTKWTRKKILNKNEQRHIYSYSLDTLSGWATPKYYIIIIVIFICKAENKIEFPRRHVTHAHTHHTTLATPHDLNAHRRLCIAAFLQDYWSRNARKNSNFGFTKALAGRWPSTPFVRSYVDIVFILSSRWRLPTMAIFEKKTKDK